MSDNSSHWCVFLPCSDAELWALPQNCLAEIVTLPAEGDLPPEEISWRGQSVPVLDLDEEHDQPWRDVRGGTGLIAVVLGLKGEGCDYWGVALRGEGLGMRDISQDEVEDVPDLAGERAVGAFRIGSSVYQIPDLLELQRDITASRAIA